MGERVVITHWVHPEIIELLTHGFDVIPNTGHTRLAYEDMLYRARDAKALMVFPGDRIDEDFLDRCPLLRIVAGVFRGRSDVDVQACTERGIWVTAAPDLLTLPSVRLAVKVFDALGPGESIPGDRPEERRSPEPGPQRSRTFGRTVGVICRKDMGRAITTRLAPLGVSTVHADPPFDGGEGTAALIDVLGKSDVIVLAVPPSEYTSPLIDRTSLSSLKRGSVIINMEQGSPVDEEAIAEALDSGLLCGYGTDISNGGGQPLLERSSAIPERLPKGVRSSGFTLYISTESDEAIRAAALEGASNIAEALLGERPQGAINEPADDGIAPGAATARTILTNPSHERLIIA